MITIIILHMNNIIKEMIHLTTLWLCNSSSPQWGRGWCTRSPDIYRGGPGWVHLHPAWAQGHFGQEVILLRSPLKISPPCSSALDPSLEGEGVAPPLLEGEGGDLEEGFQAACSVCLYQFSLVFCNLSFLHLVVAGVIGLLVTGLGSG